MGMFRKMRAIFHDDWCTKCQSKMEENRRQLYMLPMVVGHYMSHKNPKYYKENLIKVNRKADIPIATYACGAFLYECPKCGHRIVKLEIFLPVRDEEKFEDVIFFEDGELDDFLWR